MPRPKKPYRGPPANKKITEEVIMFAEFALARRFTKGQVKTLLIEKFQLHFRTCETIITKARKCLVEKTGKDQQAHKDEAYRFYDSVIRDPAATVRDRLLAQQQIVALFGLQGPIKIHHSGPDGGPIEQTVKHEFSADRFAELYLKRTGRASSGTEPAEANGN